MTIATQLLAAVAFSAGVHELTEPLTVSPTDNGCVIGPSDAGNPVILSGGRTVTGWKVGADGVWRVLLPEVKSGIWNFSELYVNGERRHRPRVPAEGFYYTTDNAYTNEPGMPFCGFVYNPTNVALQADYANANDVEVDIFYNWSVAKMRLAEIDIANRRIRFTSGRKLNPVHADHKTPRRWHLENVKEAFGRAGEWYLDRPTGVLTYRPFPGETPEKCHVVAPCLSQVVRVWGTVDCPVRNVTFRNIRICHANVVVPADGAYIAQGELDVPAAVELIRAENVSFVGCSFGSVGGWAVALGPGCYSNAVESCLFRDLGAGGVKFGAPYGGYAALPPAEDGKPYGQKVPGFGGLAWDLTGATRIENCRLVHGGKIYPAGVGILAGRTWGAKIVHNEVSHFNYTAISVGWNWDNKIVMAHDNEIAFNHCWQIGQRLLSDMGMIYTLGNQPGTTVHDNLVHGVDVFDYGGQGIYLDECTSHVKVYNNLVYDTRAALLQNFTVDCEIYNNIFYCPKNGPNLAWRRKAGSDSVAMNAHHNIIVWEGASEPLERSNDFTATREERRAEELRCPNPSAGACLDFNLYWNCSSNVGARLFRPKRLVNHEVEGDMTEFPHWTFAEWQQKSGMDQNSVFADPQFVDADELDFRLRPDSPATKLGFKPFDTRQAGLKDPHRLPPEEVRELKSSVLSVQRSLHKLANSTASHPAHLRVLFYGQSIVEQGWCTNVLAILEKRYPTAVFTWENRAVGGFESPLLVRAAETDLYPFYPDLVFFNDYGDVDIVRAMISRLRARTTADVVLWTDRVAGNEDPHETIAEDDARSRALMSIAEDCGCLLVHLRRAWSKMLLNEGVGPGFYLVDGIHLKPDAGAFQRMAEFLTDPLIPLAGYADHEGPTGRVCDYRMTSGQLGETQLVDPSFVQREDGTIDFHFTGNRVTAQTVGWRACYNASPCEVLLDGRKLGTCKELFRHGRVSGLFSWMPLILHVGAATAPVDEVWKLTFLEGTEAYGRPIRFRVDGSVTGFDGIGTNTFDFVSNSGRVRIKASDFHTWQYDFFVKRPVENGEPLPCVAARPGQWISWRTEPLFSDTLSTYLFDGQPREIVLVSGCSNGSHVLTFKPVFANRPPVFEVLTVHTPSGFEPGVSPKELAAIARREPVNPTFDPNH